MQNIWILFKNNIYMTVIKKKKTFILTLLLPILILLVIGKLLPLDETVLNIGIIDKDNSNTSVALSKILDDYDIINIVNIDDNTVNTKLLDNSINVVITIPNEFEASLLNKNEKKLSIKVLENDTTKEIVSNIIYTELVNIKELANNSYNKEQYIKLIDNHIKNKSNIEMKLILDSKVDYLKSNVYIGLIILFIFVTGFLGAVHYYGEKEDNVINRLFITSITKKQYYIAEFLSNYLFVIVQAIIGIIFINIIDINIGVNNIVLLIIMMLLGLVSVTSSICIRTFCKNYNEFNLTFNFITIFLIIAGGCFIPLEIMPKIMDNIAYLTPTGWAMRAISDLQLGLRFYNIIPHIFIIILFSVVFFTIGEYKNIKLERN